MIAAYAFAAADPYRAATNNKGIMNGIIPVVIATGNDTRAIESGAHAYAARSGQYSPFATWEKNADGDLVGSIEMPMAVGLVGGATKIHPAAKVAVKMLGVKTAGELARSLLPWAWLRTWPPCGLWPPRAFSGATCPSTPATWPPPPAPPESCWRKL